MLKGQKSFVKLVGDEMTQYLDSGMFASTFVVYYKVLI